MTLSNSWIGLCGSRREVGPVRVLKSQLLIRQSERQRVRGRDREKGRQTSKQKDRQTDRPTDPQTDRLTDRPTDRQTDRPTDQNIFEKSAKVFIDFKKCVSKYVGSIERPPATLIPLSPNPSTTWGRMGWWGFAVANFNLFCRRTPSGKPYDLEGSQNPLGTTMAAPA